MFVLPKVHGLSFVFVDSIGYFISWRVCIVVAVVTVIAQSNHEHQANIARTLSFHSFTARVADADWCLRTCFTDRTGLWQSGARPFLPSRGLRGTPQRGRPLARGSDYQSQQGTHTVFRRAPTGRQRW